MPVRRKRRPGSDRLYVTSSDGLPLGHLDLVTRIAHDVPAGYRDRLTQEANSWLWHNHMPTIGGPGDHGEREQTAIGAGVEPPAGGWDPGWEDLSLRRPGHGIAEEASRLRAERGPGADRALRLRADAQHAVADALGKLTRPSALRRARGGRWVMLNSVPMALPPGVPGTPSDEAVIDHVVIGPPGIFIVEALNVPGGRVVLDAEKLDLGGGETLELERRRRIGEEAARRVSIALARAAGATETLDPPAVTPVIAVVGAILASGGRPRGVLVTRIGQLPRFLTAFGTPLSDLAVAQIHEVARRSVTWSP